MSDLAFEQSFESHCKRIGDAADELQMALCRIVADIHSHFTESELTKLARDQMPSMPKEAVSITLKKMFKAGLIRKIAFSDDQVVYEHVFGHLSHDHFWCLECHKILEFHEPNLERLSEKTAERNGFLVARHQMQIVGLCPDCKDKAAKYGIEQKRKPSSDLTLPLAMAEDGSVVTVWNIVGGHGMRRRLAEMGFLKGESLKVINNRFAGPFIIEIKGTRLMLEHKLAHHILVTQKAKN